MSETEHTPGPWVDPEADRNHWGPYEGEDDFHAAIYDNKDIRDESNRIAVVSHTNLDTLVANCRLIAAAPDLLDALQDILAAYSIPLPKDLQRVAVDKARKAVRLGVDSKLLVLAACDCAEPALKHVSKGEARPRIAIETARRWVNGDATAKAEQESP